jgi:hypothetical protein
VSKNPTETGGTFTKRHAKRGRGRYSRKGRRVDNGSVKTNIKLYNLARITRELYVPNGRDDAHEQRSLLFMRPTNFDGGRRRSLPCYVPLLLLFHHSFPLTVVLGRCLLNVAHDVLQRFHVTWCYDRPFLDRSVDKSTRNCERGKVKCDLFEQARNSNPLV